jgi:thioredoxin-related protein
MTHRIRAWTPLLLACVSLAMALGTARSDDVQWRKDYNEARKEASEKDKPLFLDFGTADCSWCKRLDTDVFQNKDVIAQVNEQFIPIRIDGNRDPRLVEALRIQSYPTLVFASPDGKILVVQEGYVDAGRFQELLRRAAATYAAPEGLTRDYQEAARAIGASDFARAVALLKTVTEDGKDRPVQRKAKGLLKEIEDQAAGRLSRAKQLAEKGEKKDAVAAAVELVRVYPGTSAAKEGAQLLTTWTSSLDTPGEPRARKAKEMLAQAREDYRANQFLICMERCELISTHYADLGEGADAARLATEIRANPDFMKRACDQLADRLGVYYLSLAESYLQKGQPRQAITCLEKVLRLFPGSRPAQAAQARLSQIQAEPAAAVEFKKP